MTSPRTLPDDVTDWAGLTERIGRLERALLSSVSLPEYRKLQRTGAVGTGAYTTTSVLPTFVAIDTTNLQTTVSVSDGALLAVKLSGTLSTNPLSTAVFALYIDGVDKGHRVVRPQVANADTGVHVEWELPSTADDEWTVSIRWALSNAATVTMYRDSVYPLDFSVSVLSS